MNRLTVQVLIWGVFMAGGVPVSGADELTVLTESADGIAPGKRLEIDLKRRFYGHLEKRRAAFDALKSKADGEPWQNERREFFVRQLGGFPK